MFEHCTLEWYWTAPGGYDPNFVPSFVVYLPDGTNRRQQGSSAEVTMALCELGRMGFEAVACVAQTNWLLWTLRRRAS
jgi:hypothetical protein